MKSEQVIPDFSNTPPAPQPKLILGVQKPIFWLGIVSFLTDISSEMIFSVLSIFLTVILGASTVILGAMEGLADFSASSLDFIAGYLSDKTGKRKIFTILGYGFSTLAKAILVFANTVTAVVSFRVIERLGKSIRGAPRDALISSITDKSKLGYSFGFHKAMDKAGAILGPVIAYFLLTYLGQTLPTFQLIFWIALIPAILGVIVLAIFIKEKPAPDNGKRPKKLFSVYGSLEKEYKRYLKIAGLFSLGYFSFAFLLLKSYKVGFEIKDVTLLYAIFNLSFILISIPVGKIGDMFGRKKLILAEYLIYFLMCVGFIFATSKIAVIALFLLFGIFYAIDEGQTKAYISSITAEEKRASAIGIYNFITGLIYLPASLIAGLLWDKISPEAAFGFAATTSLLSFLLLAIQEHNHNHNKHHTKI
jgi:MFS family permease